MNDSNAAVVLTFTKFHSTGLSTCHYAWAFHSEAEEELLNMLPALQKGEPTWPELRSMGVGWWLRSTNKLRRCIEKVRSIVGLKAAPNIFDFNIL